MTSAYKYDIRDCDVADKAALNSFRQKRAEWANWLDDDPDHAIWSVIHSLIWRDTTFAAISELARRDVEGPLRTTLLGETIVNGHVILQVLALRRLTDRGTGAISLSRLIQDVKRNWHLLTRESFVCFDGLPYDHEAAAAEYWKDKEPGAAVWLDTTGPLAYGTSKLMHEHFDKLAGVRPADRSRTDILPKSLIKRVEGWLLNSGAEELAKWSHAYVAHAGNRSDREAIAHIQVTNNKITTAICNLACVTEALASEILYISGRTGSLMPVAQFDVFDRLQKPVALEIHRDAALDVWTKKSREWDNTLGGVREALVKGTT